jgi:hypothetical protein
MSMAVDATNAPTKSAPRLLVGAAVLLLGVVMTASASFAATRSGPSVSPRVAVFDIPSWSPPTVTWTLNVWQHNTLIGSDSGTSGVLSVTIPRAVNGTVQADVKRNKRWFSGKRVTLPGRGHGHGGGGHGGGGHGGGGSGNGGGGSGGSGGSGSSGGSGGSGGSGSGGSGSGGSGSGGNGGGGVSTTTIPPITITGGGGTGGGGSGSFAGTTKSALGSFGTQHLSGPATSAAQGAKTQTQTQTPAPAATDLAFTGTGSDFRTTILAGSGLILLGAFLLMRRRAERLEHSWSRPARWPAG